MGEWLELTWQLVTSLSSLTLIVNPLGPGKFRKKESVNFARCPFRIFKHLFVLGSNLYFSELRRIERRWFVQSLT